MSAIQRNRKPSMSPELREMAHPALNIVRAPEPAPEHDVGERVWATIPKELVATIEDFHFEHRLKNRSQAIRCLIEYGLEYAKGKRMT